MVTKRKKSNWDKELLGKVKGKIDEAKSYGSELSDIAKKRGPQVAQELSVKSKDRIDKGLKSVKKITVSNDDTVELIKKLGALKKSGIITDVEFREKKKELLERI